MKPKEKSDEEKAKRSEPALTTEEKKNRDNEGKAEKKVLKS